MGRQTVCLRCGEKGHQRSTSPLKTTQVQKSYAAAARGEQDDWQTAGRNRKSKPAVEETVEEMEHVPLSPESEVGATREHVPLSPESEVGATREHVPLSPESEVGDKMAPPQDRRGRGQEQKEGSTLPPCKTNAGAGMFQTKKKKKTPWIRVSRRGTGKGKKPPMRRSKRKLKTM